ncbi:MAG: hypothetical protein EBR82_63555 [Caulobacteraceae bacterium]|nr:hypothetical protein [Caulobacteraceae bacterium]
MRRVGVLRVNARHGRHGEAWRGWSRTGSARQGRHGVAWQGVARQGLAWHGVGFYFISIWRIVR